MTRLLRAVAAAAALAAVLFGVCVAVARSPLRPAPPSVPEGARAGGTGMMHGMETSPAPSTVSRETSEDVLAVLAGERDLGRASALIRLIGLSPAIEQTASVTVFAPTDEAFEKLSDPTYVQLLEPENVPRLLSVVRCHVVAGSFSPSLLVERGELVTLDGAKVAVRRNGAQILVQSATITERVKAANGWVYRLDSVLAPSSP